MLYNQVSHLNNKNLWRAGENVGSGVRVGGNWSRELSSAGNTTFRKKKKGVHGGPDGSPQPGGCQRSLVLLRGPIDELLGKEHPGGDLALARAQGRGYIQKSEIGGNLSLGEQIEAKTRITKLEKYQGNPKIQYCRGLPRRAHPAGSDRHGQATNRASALAFSSHDESLLQDPGKLVQYANAPKIVDLGRKNHLRGRIFNGHNLLGVSKKRGNTTMEKPPLKQI